MAKKLTFEYVKEYIENFNCKLLSEEYEGNAELLIIQCKCGEIFKEKLINIKYNNYCMCDKCHQLNKSQNSFDEFMEELSAINYTYISKREEYKNSKSLICIKCEKGHIFKTSKNRIHAGRKCTECNKINPKPRQIRKDYNIIKEEIESCNYELLTKKEDYKGTKSEITIKCNKGHIYQSSYNVFQGGHRCPHCKISKGEQMIKYILDKYKLKYEQQYKFENCKFNYILSFDFYLIDYKTCIEYDGEQHFKPIDFAGKGEKWAEDRFQKQVERDNIKNSYCKDNDIKLIRIPYWDFDNIEKILELELNL